MKDKIKILYVIGQLDIGGSERQLIYMASHINKDLFEPIVCSLSKNSPLADDFKALGIEVVILPEKMKPDITRAWRLAKIAREHQADIIHSYLFVANAWSRIVGLLLHIPVVISERSFEVHKPLWIQIIDRLLAPWTKLMIANSESGAVLAVKRHEIPADRVVTVHNGIPLDHYNNKHDEKIIRQELGLSEEKSLVGIVGNLTESKDHERFFYSIAQVIKQISGIHILCVGEGPLRSRLENLVKSLGLESHVTFTGLRHDVPKILNAIDVLVLSSRWEGLPNVILEGMAASRPIIATNVGGVAEIVVMNETGFLVSPGDIDAMAYYIQKLLTEKTLAIEMGRRGRVRIEEYFSLDKMVNKTEAIYLEVLSNRE